MHFLIYISPINHPLRASFYYNDATVKSNKEYIYAGQGAVLLHLHSVPRRKVIIDAMNHRLYCASLARAIPMLMLSTIYTRMHFNNYENIRRACT